MEYRILGPLDVSENGQQIELTGQRQRALLTALLLHAGEVVSRDRLIDFLWGDAAPRTATTSLHNAVRELRRVVGDALATKAPGYVLRIERDQLDAARFEDLLHDAQSRDSHGRVGALREALALWRGPALVDVSYETFAINEANRLEELRLVAREELTDAELELGRHDVLIPELEATVAANPLRERVWGQLMLALYRAGRQADASEAFQRVRRHLLDELGIEPGPALRQLHGAIIRQEADLPATGARSSPTDAGQIDHVVAALLSGRLVPVLGEDADPLATSLAERFRYPRTERAELPRVSQYAAATSGYGPLYDELRELVYKSGEAGAVHTFFASLPPLLRERRAPQLLIVTTSYSSVLESAFAAAGEAVDVVSYISTGPHRGKFAHSAPGSDTRVIDLPNTYATELSLDLRPVILKIQGQAGSGAEAGSDSFVVTEDDYIQYLGRGDVASAIPVGLAATLRRSHFLFLGYTIHDWHLRLILGRLWGETPVAYRSWAVHPKPRPAERELWRRLDVDLAETPLDLFVQGLAGAVGLATGAVS